MSDPEIPVAAVATAGTDPTTGTPIATATLQTAGVPTWRLQTIRLLQMASSSVAALGALNLAGVIALVPPQYAAIITAVAAIMRLEAPQLIHFIGDLVDDGQLNGSFQSIASLVTLLLSLCFFTSCAALKSGTNAVSFDAQGYVWDAYTASNGQAYKAGLHVDTSGKIDRYAIEWVENGLTLEEVYIPATKSLTTYIINADGSSIQFDQKSGIVIHPPVTLGVGATVATVKTAGQGRAVLRKMQSAFNSRPRL